MSQSSEVELGGRCWFRTSDPCRVKAIGSQGQPRATRSNEAAGRGSRLPFSTRIYTAAAAAALCFGLAACGGGDGDDEDDGESRRPTIDCEAHPDQCR